MTNRVMTVVVADIPSPKKNKVMKSVIFASAISALLMAASGCSAPISENERLMGVIDSQVILPAGALPLDLYSRNYALRSDGKVIGVYILSLIHI